MKKKLLALMMVLALVMIPLAGCGGSDEANDTVENTDTPTEFYYSFQIYGIDEALLAITFVDENGEPYVEETGSYGWFGTPEMTIGQMMEERDVQSIEPKCDEYEFLGWKAVEEVVETDESGVEKFVQKELYDGKVFTLEEVKTLELLPTDIYFNSVWDLVCGGCEERKICDVYYIDDERYFVCKDCYEEFATGMGLI